MAIIKLSERLAYQDKVEDFEDMKKGLFADVYIKSAKNVIEIVESAEEYYENDEEKRRTNMSIYSNNIMAFVGDRGTGKSSAMKSFVKALTNGGLWEIEKKLDRDKCFLALPVIDPSQLKCEEGILESVIANMYSDIKQIIENTNRKCCSNEVPVDKMQAILSQFDRTYISLKCYRAEGRRGYDDENDTALEKLDRLSSSQKLRTDMQELAEKYIEMCVDNPPSSICSKNKNRKSQFIVIAIDDLDMNIEYGFEHAEEIRKFLMLPNVIIVMSLNIDQFSQLVQREYLVKYEIMIRNHYLNNEIYQLAEKYITKFLPLNRRCAMPDLAAVSLSSFSVEYGDQPKESELLAEYFLKKIYTTTGILLLKNNAGGHGIIPDNLREIHQLHALLKNLNPVDLYECIIGENLAEKIELKLKLKLNLEVFGNFLFNSYFKKNMPLRYLKIFDEFNGIDSNHLNIFVIQKISKLFMKEKDTPNFDDKSNGKKPKGSIKDQEPETLKIVPEDHCIGDVLQLLNDIYNIYNNSTTQKFVEGMKILYSIRILKLIFIAENWTETRIIIGELMHGGQFWGKLDYQFEKSDKDLKDLFMNSYYLQFFIAHYNKLDKAKREMLFEPAYHYKFNPGSTKYYTIDLSSFIANLLDLEVINKRVTNENFNADEKMKIQKWRKEHVAALPVWSLDFIDYFFKKLPRKIELSTKMKGDSESRQNATEIFASFIDVCIEIIGENEFMHDIECQKNKRLADVIQTTLESIIGEDTFDVEFVKTLANRGSVPFDEKLIANLQPVLKEKISLKNKTLRAIKIFDKLYYVTRGYELLTKTIAVLIGKDKSKYETLKESNELKALNIVESVNNDRKQQRLELPPDVFLKSIYITTTRSNDQNLELCKSAFRAIGSDYQDNFEVYCEPEPSSPDEEIRDETK